MKQNVEICSSCIIRASEDSEESTFTIKKKFLEEVTNRLKELRSDIEWNVSYTSCMRFCPSGRVSLVVQNQMDMSMGTTVDDVARDVIARASSN